jgi:DNA-binding CsgD family transcriptional regulator
MTSREIEIIKLVAAGKTNMVIAQDLNISKHTVITHRKNINKKLNASNPVIMLEMARQRKII